MVRLDQASSSAKIMINFRNCHPEKRKTKKEQRDGQQLTVD